MLGVSGISNQGTFRDFKTGSNLSYHRARYYDPTTGRFISEDPVEFAGSGPNFYLYVNNNSVDWVDPAGLARKSHEE